ncbi:MAG: hypothetical protein KDC35_08810 [Acidobacteria bacterium]|nr:hypothetical protein [Acidobacteriota bacterium]
MRARTWILMFFSGILAAQTRIPTRHNRDIQRSFDDLSYRLNRSIEDHNRGFAPSGPSDLLRLLEDLQHSVAENANVRVDTQTRHTFDLDVDNQVTFGGDPQLPKENKSNGRWSFQPIQFDVIIPNLYVFGVQFQANRTIRIRSVTLHFHDGESVIHNGWWDVDRGNGQVFDKRDAIPMLNAWQVNKPRRAKRLRAIEVVGSAQDRGHAARLSFVFRIPDPAQTPYAPAMELMDRVSVAWSRFSQLDAQTLNAMLMDIGQIADALEIDFCPRLVAL